MPGENLPRRVWNRPGGALNFFFGGCVPRGFQNVGLGSGFSLKNGVLGTKIWKKIGSRELEFWPKHG